METEQCNHYALYIVKGSNLAAMDLNGKSDPYVTISYQGKNPVHKTKVFFSSLFLSLLSSLFSLSLSFSSLPLSLSPSLPLSLSLFSLSLSSHLNGKSDPHVTISYQGKNPVHKTKVLFSLSLSLFSFSSLFPCSLV